MEDWLRRGFPLPFGHRHSLLGHPIPAGGLGPPHGRLTGPQGRTPTGFPRSARTSCDRGGRPLYPGDGGAHPDRATPGRRLPLRSGQSLHPANHPTGRVRVNEASTRVQAIRPSGLPLARGRPDGTGSPSASPGLRTPPTKSRTTHAEVGTGHRARTWNYPLNSSPSISNPVVHSMRATSRRTSQPSSQIGPTEAAARRLTSRLAPFGVRITRAMQPSAAPRQRQLSACIAVARPRLRRKQSRC